MWKLYLIFIASIFGVYLFDCRGGGLKHINENSNKGFVVDKSWVRRLLRIEKGTKYISYLSFAFVLLGYAYILAIIPCGIMMMFVTREIAKWIVLGHFGLVIITLLVVMTVSTVLDKKKREKWM